MTEQPPRILGRLRGPHGIAARVASVVPTVVDSWALQLDTGNYILTAVKEAQHWRLYLSDTTSNRWQCRVAFDSADQGAIAEVARHLARNVVRGGLEAPPQTRIATVAWDAAVSLALLFVERFGIYEEIRKEKP